MASFPGLDDLAKNIVELAKSGAPDETMVNAVESIRAIATWQTRSNPISFFVSFTGNQKTQFFVFSKNLPTIIEVHDMKAAVNDSHALAQQQINQKAWGDLSINVSHSNKKSSDHLCFFHFSIYIDLCLPNR
jgi:hypothetical protein